MDSPQVHHKKMKHPWLAFVLSAVLPGAGLAYLGKWRGALVNFAVALAIPVLFLLVMPEEITERIHYLILTIAVGSGAWAHAAAAQRSERTD